MERNSAFVAAREPPDAAILVVYGGLDVSVRKVTGSEILTTLLDSGLWFSARVPASARSGMKCVFYETRVGFTGDATLEEIGSTGKGDIDKFERIPLRMYPFRWKLSSVRRFIEPTDARHILGSLSFISNKHHWGYAFRSSPRLIPMVDYKIIIAASTFHEVM